MHSPQGQGVYRYFTEWCHRWLEMLAETYIFGGNCRFVGGLTSSSVFHVLVWLNRPDAVIAKVYENVTCHQKIDKNRKLHLSLCLFYNHFIMSSFLRENDTTWPVHTHLSSTGPRGGPFEEDEPQGKGHSGARADWKGLPHWPGAVYQRGGPASAKFAGRFLSGSRMKSLAG